VLVDNINAEGEWPNVIGITADDNCWPVVLWD